METLIKFRVSNPKFKILLKMIKTIKCNKKLTISNHFDVNNFVIPSRFMEYNRGIIINSEDIIKTLKGD